MTRWMYALESWCEVSYQPPDRIIVCKSNIWLHVIHFVIKYPHINSDGNTFWYHIIKLVEETSHCSMALLVLTSLHIFQYSHSSSLCLRRDATLHFNLATVGWNEHQTKLWSPSSNLLSKHLFQPRQFYPNTYIFRYVSACTITSVVVHRPAHIVYLDMYIHMHNKDRMSCINF